MIWINEKGGLGKPRWLRKITLKNVAKAAFVPHLLIPKKKITLKNVAKAAFAPHTLILKKRRK